MLKAGYGINHSLTLTDNISHFMHYWANKGIQADYLDFDGSTLWFNVHVGG